MTVKRAREYLTDVVEMLATTELTEVHGLAQQALAELEIEGQEHVVVSFDREGLAAHLEAMGYSVEDGLTEEDTAALAAAYGEALDALSAAGDVFIDTMQEVLGARLQEEDY